MSITVDCNDKKRNARRNVSLLYYLPRRPLHSKCRCNASVMKVLSSDIRSLCEGMSERKCHRIREGVLTLT
jgi:hypothetical protein